MKDAQHHLKNLQKKVMRELKKEKPSETSTSSVPVILKFTRPKILQNRRKSSLPGLG